MFNRIRLYLVIGLCAAPMLIGSDPIQLCEVGIITGRVVASNGAAIEGARVQIDHVSEEGLHHLSNQDSWKPCMEGISSYNRFDTSDSDGSFAFNIMADDLFSIRNDSLRIAVSMPDTSIVGILTISSSDTTSAQLVYSEGRFPEDNGCGTDCSASPIVYHSGTIYFYRDHTLILP